VSSEPCDSKVLTATQNHSDINSYSMYSYAHYAQVTTFILLLTALMLYAVLLIKLLLSINVTAVTHAC